MNYLKDYREGEKFVGTYLCKQKQILKTKAGKTYYSLTLQDKTGTADGKIWELNNGIANFEPMDYIHCEGMVTSFQGNLQMNISRVASATRANMTRRIMCLARTKMSEKCLAAF